MRGMPRRGRSGGKGEESPSQPRRGRSGGKGEESPSQPRPGRSGRKGEESPSRPCTLRGDEADVVPGFAEKAQAMMDETQATTSTNTLTPLEDLEKRIRELRMQKKAILRAREQAKAVVTKLINENLFIAFVDELEKAHQYFAFKDLLKQSPDIKADSTAERIYNTIAESQVLKELSKNLDKEVIRTAINEYIYEMKDDQEIRSRYSYRKCLTCCESITSQSDITQDMDAVCRVADTFPGLNDDEKESELMNYKMCLASSLASKEDRVTKYTEKIEKERDRALAKLKEDYDYYASVNAIYDLVFKARQSKYVMDENPKKELEQIMTRPSIDCILLERFEEMMISSHSPKVRNHDVCDLRVSPSGSADGSESHYNHVDDEEPTLENVEKFIRSMNDKALEKYKHLRSVETIVEAKGIITDTLDKEKDTEPENKFSRKRTIMQLWMMIMLWCCWFGDKYNCCW